MINYDNKIGSILSGDTTNFLIYNLKHFMLSGSVNNLANARYFTRRADSYPGPGIIPSDARGFFLTLQARF